MLTRCQRQFSGWMAILAMLLSALAPAISHASALLQNDSITWQQVCTASADRQGESSAPPEHCSFCLTHVEHSALPLQTSGLLPPPDGGAILQAHFSFEPRPPAAWASPQLRGPPALT